MQRGTLLLCKVFIGQAVETTSPARWGMHQLTLIIGTTWLCWSSVTRAAFPSADSVFRVHGVAQQGAIADLYSKDWFVFDSCLVLPEYIIHFQYLSPVSLFPFLQWSSILFLLVPAHSWKSIGPLHIYSLTSWGWGDCLCLPASQFPWPSVSHARWTNSPGIEWRVHLSHHPCMYAQKDCSSSHSMHQLLLQEINLHNHRLTRFRLASSLLQMTSLNLSGNELSIAEDFANLVCETSHFHNIRFEWLWLQPNLELLDLSFNKLDSLQGMKVFNSNWRSTCTCYMKICWQALFKLKCLDVSWNFLSSYQDDLGPLRKHCPVLQALDTRHNPWKKVLGACTPAFVSMLLFCSKTTWEHMSWGEWGLYRLWMEKQCLMKKPPGQFAMLLHRIWHCQLCWVTPILMCPLCLVSVLAL